MRLGIDLDGVVADFTAGWIRRYNDEFGADLVPESIQTWNGMEEMTHFPDMAAFWDWAAGQPGDSVFRHLETYHGATETLARLDADGHEVVILTTKPDWAVHDTFAWIADRAIPTREVHILYRKWRVPCDVYLDDAPHQIHRIHLERPEAHVCRFVRPWNLPVPGVHDVENWPDFEALVMKLAG
jgi:5'(3')-deoxyribonucleotidase